jgi:O-methyltransferase
VNDLIFRMLTHRGGNQDHDRSTAIYHMLSAVCAYGVPGDVVEIGCNEGETSIFLQTILNYRKSDKKLHVYDSFQGMCASTAEDKPNGFFYMTDLVEGGLKTDPAVVVARFRERVLKQPTIHPGWVADTIPTELPEQIAFALIDVDFYQPILHSLIHVYQRLPPGAVVIVDDYGWEGTPGAKLALDEFLAGKPEKVQLMSAADGLNKSGSAGFRKGEA